MSDSEELVKKLIDADTERRIYKITEGVQRLNGIGRVQYIQIDLPKIPEPIEEKLEEAFDSALDDGFYINRTIVLEQMDAGDSFLRTLNALRKLYLVTNSLSIYEIQAVVNIDYKGERMDIILTYDPGEHDISLVSVSKKEEFFKILEYVRFFWCKSRPRI
ncbi:hypothetical protein EU523_01345 [Candidatus Heimdallarchaeota archaeon]|nr:MAG: hypothetical protein EU523_01345 [Candidatus Heimdallarchaeota archaeon]